VWGALAGSRRERQRRKAGACGPARGKRSGPSPQEYGNFWFSERKFKQVQTIWIKQWDYQAPKIPGSIQLESSWDGERLCLKKLPQILNGFWTKIQRIFYELNFNRNSLENLETLEFDEIWSTSSMLHLIARKSKFLA
jgi:hypothetical protein